MVEYTTEKSKKGILTCLIIISGGADLLFNYIVNFFLTNYLYLNNFNIYYNGLLFLLIFISFYRLFYKIFDKYIWNKKPILDYLNIHDLNGNWEGYTTSQYGKKSSML